MAHVEKRGPGRWRARYRGPDGRERSQTFDRKVDVERWLAQVEIDKARGHWHYGPGDTTRHRLETGSRSQERLTQ